MSKPLTNKRKAAILGASALGASALIGGLLLSPATADNFASAIKSTVSNVRGDDHGPRGGQGTHGQDMIGKLLQAETVTKQADGTFSIERAQIGTVTAVDATTITIESLNGVALTYTPGAATVTREKVAATLADFAVGDHARVRATVVDDVVTVTELSGESAESWAAHEAERAAHDAAKSDGTHVGPADGTGDGVMGDGRGGKGGHGEKGGRDGHGEKGGHGRGMGQQGPDNHAMRGEIVSSERVFEKADGTFVTIRDQFGTVSATSGTSLTVVSENGAEVSYTVGAATITRDHAAATLADVVVGDHVRVSGEVVDGNLTVTVVDAMSETAWADREAHRAEHDANKTSPTATPSA
jgi:hypothetical protein